MLKQILLDALEAIIREITVSSSPLQQQLERARTRVKPCSVEQSPFFTLLPVNIGIPSVDDLDTIIAEKACKED